MSKENMLNVIIEDLLVVAAVLVITGILVGNGCL